MERHGALGLHERRGEALGDDSQPSQRNALPQSPSHGDFLRLRDGRNYDAFKAIGNVVYGRYYVRLETRWPWATRVHDFPDVMSGHSLRMGGQNYALQWNRQSDDATLPSQSPAGIALSKVPRSARMCVEFMIDQAQGLISTWVDGNLVAGLVADATPTADVDMALGTAYKPSPEGFNIGWQNYGAGR